MSSIDSIFEILKRSALNCEFIFIKIKINEKKEITYKIFSTLLKN